MNPEQNEYPVDYLNQIAPQTTNKSAPNKWFLVLIGAILVAALGIGGFIIFGQGGNSALDKMERLSVRLSTLKTIASNTQRQLKDEPLRNTNSNLSIFLTNAERDIQEQLTKAGADPKKIGDAVKKEESGDELKEILEEARLNATLDREYASEMSYQLETILSLTKDIGQRTNNASLKESLKKTQDNIAPILSDLTKFSSSKS